VVFLRRISYSDNSTTYFGSSYEPHSGWLVFLVTQNIQLAMLLLLLTMECRIIYKNFNIRSIV